MAVVPFNIPTVGGGGSVDPSVLQKVLDMLGSKGGQTLVNAAGAGLQAYGAGKQADANREANAQQFAQDSALRLGEQENADQFRRATAATDATPLGQDQEFAQRQAIIGKLLGSARNVQSTPGDPAVAAAMGNRSGGIRLPEGGLDLSMIDRLFGDAATQASIAQRAKNVGQINPNAPAPPLHELFGQAEGGTENPFMTDIRTSNATAEAAQEAARLRQREIIKRALDEDITGEKQRKPGKAASALTDAAKYAATGSMFGPWGTAVGGGIGLLKGLFS